MAGFINGWRSEVKVAGLFNRGRSDGASGWVL